MKNINLFRMSVIALAILNAGCEPRPENTDQKQANEQAKALEQAHAQIGMPAISNFEEKRMMKDLYEVRDKPFPTHTYLPNELQGCLMYLGPSIGYGLPYSTQFTSPTRLVDACPGCGHYDMKSIPQAEPNGLFMPASADGTWIMMKDPEGGKEVKAVYVEPRVVVSPFRLTSRECPEKKAQADEPKGK